MTPLNPVALEAALLPCPFCGSADIDPLGWASTESAGPACNECGASAGGVKNTVAQNVAAWNRRTPPKPAPASVDYVRVPRDAADDRYLVWSHQHGAWWRADSCGYVRDVREAGIYARAEAVDISHTSRDHWTTGQRPEELPIRVADLPEWARAALAAAPKTEE